MDKMLRNKAAIAVLILPGLRAFFMAVLAPIVLSVVFSLSDSTGVGRYHLVGLKNYI